MRLFSFSERYALGLLFILLVAVIWSGASILLQYIFDNLDFQSPFLITYICNSLFVIYLPLWQLWAYLGIVKDPPGIFHRPFEKVDLSKNEIVEDSSSHIFLPPPTLSSSELSKEDTSSVGIKIYSESSNDSSYSDSSKRNSKEYTHRDVLRAALIISPLWFLSNCSYNYSLLMTSVSSSTIISNLSAAFTLTFAYLAGLEEVTVGKVLGIVLCFSGVVFVALQDTSSDDSSRTILGDVVALLASAGYGIYTTVIRMLIPDDEGISMQLLLGYIGVINAISTFPVLLAMIIFNIESIAQVSGAVLGFIFMNGICDNVLSDYLWARAVLLTSPTVATLGMSITIPLAIISDICLGKATFSYMSTIGAILVITGFFLVNIDNSIWENLISRVRLEFTSMSLIKDEKNPSHSYQTN